MRSCWKRRCNREELRVGCIPKHTVAINLERFESTGRLSSRSIQCEGTAYCLSVVGTANHHRTRGGRRTGTICDQHRHSRRHSALGILCNKLPSVVPRRPNADFIHPTLWE